MITRIISGTIGIALAAYVIQEGGTTFVIAAAVLAVLAWFEFTRAFSYRGGSPALFSGLFGIGGMLYGAYLGQLDMILMALMASAVLALLTSVILRGDVSVPDVCISVAGIVYIGLPFAHLILLRALAVGSYVTPIETFDLGTAMVWVMFIGTWSSDSFAYFAGRAFGSHKLAPRLLPQADSVAHDRDTRRLGNELHPARCPLLRHFLLCGSADAEPCAYTRYRARGRSGSRGGPYGE